MKTKFLFIVLVINCLVANSQVPNYVPTTGLKGFWPLCNNANDISGNGNNGTINGAIPTTDRFNTAASAYSFNGTSNYISTTMTGILGNSPRAVSFWAKSTNSTTTMSGVAWGDEQSFPNNGVRYECAFNAASSGVCIIGADCAIEYAPPVNAYNNNWHHYVFQFAGGDLQQVQIYQDAVLLTNITYTHFPNTTLNTSSNWPVNFGRIPYSIPHYFQGALDEIGIWDRVLTPTEIQQLFNGNGACSGVGLSEVEFANGKVNIYPNPNNGNFTVIADEAIEIKIINVVGQIVAKKKLSGNSKVEINDLPSGIYFVSDLNDEWRKKMIVSK